MGIRELSAPVLAPGTSSDVSLDWHSSAKRYLERLGKAEWEAQGRPQPKGRGKHRVQRYVPSEYHRSLIDALNRNDEHEFKRLKMLEGYSSELGL